MWSLPNIVAMNSEAEAEKSKLETACETGILDGEKLICEWANHESKPCSGDLRHYLWYDIFSNDPKGILTLCEQHDGYYGSPSEGYFDCAGCGKIMTENYTWENYYHNTDNGPICLRCYAEEELLNEKNWIDLNDDKAIAAVDEKAVRKAKHLIAVEMPVPPGIEFKNNVEYDSWSGKSISGGGAEELQETLRTLKAEGFNRAILILDAAYQFAVSVAVYVATKDGQYDTKSEAA